MQFMVFLLFIWTALPHALADCSNLLINLKNRPPEIQRYETLRTIGLEPVQDIQKFRAQQGISVNKRNAKGAPIEATIRVLSDNRYSHISVIGDFNGWSMEKAVPLTRDGDSPYFIGTLTGVSDGMEYRLIVNGEELLDPAATTFSKGQYLNSVFWDLEGLSKHELKNPIPDLRKKPVVLTETEINDLVKKWSYEGNMGPKNLFETYSFISKSGVIDELKKSGINAIEFMPFTTSSDVEFWAGRYLVYGLFGPDLRYGTPKEFAEMIDKFNGAGIAVIMDTVVSHFPYKLNEGIRNLTDVGLHHWKKENGQQLYGNVLTEWSTLRYDYGNPYIRRFLIDSILTMMKNYGITGIRLDNYDGMSRVPGGWDFLRELMAELRKYRPEALAVAESFDQNKMVTARLDEDGQGMNARAHPEFFDFIKESAQKRTEEIDMEKLRQALRRPWQIQEASRLAYVTNHDEAANPRGGATGAYFASLVNGGGWRYVEGKTKVFAALAMLSGPIYMDMPQMRLLQEGGIAYNHEVEWERLQLESPRSTYKFFADLSNYYASQPAFAFMNYHGGVENHTDYQNKILSLERIDFDTGKHVYVLLNLGHYEFRDYRFGVNAQTGYKLVVDSDQKQYGGSNQLTNLVMSHPLQADSWGIHDKPHSLSIPYVAPFSVTVIEEN